MDNFGRLWSSLDTPPPLHLPKAERKEGSATASSRRVRRPAERFVFCCVFARLGKGRQGISPSEVRDAVHSSSVSRSAKFFLTNQFLRLQ